MDPLLYDSQLTSLFESTGAPLAPSVPPKLPQYSNMGRMEAEFLDDESVSEVESAEARSTIARGRITRILGFWPQEGRHGTRISISLLCGRGAVTPGTKVAFRVKMGNIPLMTTIFAVRSASEVGGCWELQVVAPDPIQLNVVGTKVPLIVQALDVVSARIVDDVCIGSFEFTALAPRSADSLVPNGPTLIGDPETSEDTMVSPSAEDVGPMYSPFSIAHPPTETYAANRKRSHLSIEVPSQGVLDSTEDDLTPDAPPPMTLRGQLSQPSQKHGEDTAYPGSINIHGDLNSMTRNWTGDEVNNNRRLVEFFCVQDCGRIDVEFAPISGESALDTSRNVASCIWWEDMEDYVITSVDTIGLLERLVGTKFTTEEKNRVRRNLQGFKPSTISKNLSESESFFKLLMNFPPPRPRNIEKDVKTFSWSKLPNMLEKVISKYRFITSPTDSDSDSQKNSQSIRVVRELEGVSSDSPSVVGPAFSTTSPMQRRGSDAYDSHAGISTEIAKLIVVPSTDKVKPPEELKPLEGSISYPHGLVMASHNDGPAFGSTDELMASDESSADMYPLSAGAEQEITYDPHFNPFTVPLDLPLNDDLYQRETEEYGFRDDTTFSTHIFQGYP